MIGITHRNRTGSPPNANPDKSGASGPASALDGESSSSTPSYPLPSGNVEAEWYHRTLCPGPNQVTARHGYVASQPNTRAASADGIVVPSASSTRA